VKAINRLDKYLETKKIKPLEFERRCKISNGYFARQLKKGGSIGSDILERIAEGYPELNLIWLITGKGAMITAPPITTKEDEKSNMMVEEQQAKYERKTQLAHDIQKKVTEMLAIDGIKTKGERKKKS